MKIISDSTYFQSNIFRNALVRESSRNAIPYSPEPINGLLGTVYHWDSFDVNLIFSLALPYNIAGLEEFVF